MTPSLLSADGWPEAGAAEGGKEGGVRGDRVRGDRDYFTVGAVPVT